jgi:hypothetical protein
MDAVIPDLHEISIRQLILGDPENSLKIALLRSDFKAVCNQVKRLS